MSDSGRLFDRPLYRDWLLWAAAIVAVGGTAAKLGPDWQANSYDPLRVVFFVTYYLLFAFLTALVPFIAIRVYWRWRRGSSNADSPVRSTSHLIEDQEHPLDGPER
jgi:hypothetical protein